MSEVQELENGDKEAFGAIHEAHLRALLADAIDCGISPEYLSEYLSDMADTLEASRVLSADEIEDYGDNCECGAPYLADGCGAIFCLKCDKEAGDE